MFFCNISIAFRTQEGHALTMRYGIPIAITPTPTIISIIGFWNIPIILKDCGGTKYWFFCLGCSLIGYGSVIATAGDRGVPGTYGLTSGVEPESVISIRNCEDCS
jgi:hypothetical protein